VTRVRARSLDLAANLCGIDWSLVELVNNCEETIKKATKRLYFLVLLKRAGVRYNDIINFYCTVIRPVLEYCSPIFHHSLPDYLSDDLERVQKRALSIIAPDKSYKHCLDSFGLRTLRDRRNEQCVKLFNSISSDQHKLACLLSPKHYAYGHYNIRHERVFDLPRFYTNRFKQSFIPAMCRRANAN